MNLVTPVAQPAYGQREEQNFREFVRRNLEGANNKISALSVEVGAAHTHLTPQQFGAVGDGTTDDSAAFTAMLSYAYSVRQVGTYQEAIPLIWLPAGKYLLTTVGVLSAAFTSLTEGLHFIGDGPGSTELIYDNSSVATNNHALDSAKLRRVSFENLKIRSVQSTSKFIKWYNSGSGSGSYFSMTKVNVEGSYLRFFDIQGTTLGSETKWDNVSGTVPVGGVFFYVVSTNPQSLGHCFINCTIAARGTVFEFNAGGNFKWYGGYTSLFSGGSFIKTRGTGAEIGTSNKDFTFHGWHPETVTTGDVTLVDAQQGSFCFERCNFGQLAVTAAAQITIISGVSQRVTELTFRDCINPKKISVDDACDVLFDGCEMGNNWEDVVISYTRKEATNYLSPRIRVVNRKDGPDADPFFFERDVGVAHNIPPLYASTFKGRTAPHKRLLWRYGTTGQVQGLIGQNGGVYNTPNTIDTIPLGSIVTAIWVVFIAGHASLAATARKLKVENYDASVTYSLRNLTVDDTGTFATEKTFNGNVAGVFRTSDLWHKAYDANGQTIKVFLGQTGGSSANTLTDYGYIMVDYF